MKDTIKAFDVNISTLSLEETVQELIRRIKNNEIIEHVGVNSNKIVLMQQNVALKNIVQTSDFINADGISVVQAIKYLFNQKIERVTGIDTMIELLKQAEAHQLTVYFLGAKEQVLKKMILRILNEYPQLKIAGYHHGYFKTADEPKIVSQIQQLKPDMIFVGITSPYKEFFIRKYKYDFQSNLLMGVGGSFDVLSGQLKRAPKWLQRIGLEWLFRFVQEPKRLFKRYVFENLTFLKIVFQEKKRMRRELK